MATAVKEKPILFSGPMVRAILEGRKTQTRRVVSVRNSTVLGCTGARLWSHLHWDAPGVRVDRGFPNDSGVYEYHYMHVPACHPKDEFREGDCFYRVRCSWEPGDRLWVRETWGLWDTQPGDGPDGAKLLYRATEGDLHENRYQLWRPSIHMPRWASRLSLEVTAVRVEQLQDISANDICSEGAVERPHQCEYLGKCPVSAFDGCVYPDLKSLWAAGWDQINGKTNPWNSNPWVWVLEFKKVEA